MMQPRIILLKEGTDTSQGKGQLISNINACRAIFDIVKTTLGPGGMDKLIYKEGGTVTISNDGATIIKLLDVVHPAAQSLVDIAKSQDNEVGDGTTTVVLLASEFLENAKGFIEDGVHPQIIIKGFRMALDVVLEKLQELAVDVGDRRADPKTHRQMLERCAQTAMNSKLISGYKDMYSVMVVDAIMHLDDDMDLKNVAIKKVPGGAATDSFLVEGVSFKKTFSYAGFEQQPKYFENPLIVALNVELELKSESASAEIRLSSPEEYQKVVEAEWKIIYDKLDKIVRSGAKIVLSRLPIGDLATQYFADRNIFCAGRVEEGDLLRVCKATGAVVQTSLNDLARGVMGTCGVFEEKQIGAERFNFFSGCSHSKTCTLIIRGGSNQFLEETERSLHDALMVVKRATVHHSVVGGGGAIEMELSRHLRTYAKTIHSKIQLIVAAYAQSLEIIPRTLCENAGFDSTDVVNDLRAKHAQGHKWFGVDLDNGGTVDTLKKHVWEPALLKRNALTAATEAACLILSVDETIRMAQAQSAEEQQQVGGGN